MRGPEWRETVEFFKKKFSGCIFSSRYVRYGYGPTCTGVLLDGGTLEGVVRSLQAFMLRRVAWGTPETREFHMSHKWD